MPKFPDIQVWQQAEALMQPAFIRLVANIGKQLEQSDWKGQYEDSWVWAEDVPAAIQAEVMQLRQELADLAAASDPAQVARQQAIEQHLASLPSPYPGYQLCLTHPAQPPDMPPVRVDLWALCYQICFRDYDVASGTSRPKGFGQAASSGVAVDSNLFDAEGEVDWDRLDAKTRQWVDRIFANLPTP